MIKKIQKLWLLGFLLLYRQGSGMQVLLNPWEILGKSSALQTAYDSPNNVSHNGLFVAYSQHQFDRS